MKSKEQKVKWWFPGPGNREKCVYCLTSIDFSVLHDEKHYVHIKHH